MRIGINVPNELLDRMKPFKNGFNVSEICREAIKNYVEAYERAVSQAKDDDTEMAVERLYREHIEKEVDWEALGHEDAKLWVKLASLDNFDHLFHNISRMKELGREIDFYVGPIIPGTKQFSHRQNEYQDWFSHQFELDKDTNHIEKARALYDRAWLFYVSYVWQMLNERIKEDANKREKAMKKKRENIEVPEHLRDTSKLTSDH